VTYVAENKIRSPEELLKEVISDDEAYTIAIRLYKAYTSGGKNSLKEEIKKIVKEYLESE